MTMNRSVRQKFHAGQLTGKVSTLVTTDSGKSQRWIFACGTEFHLFIAYILCSVAPAQTRCTLVLEDNHRINAFIAGVQQVSIWDHVEIIYDGRDYSYTALMTLEEDELGRFFYFSWGFPRLTRLFAEAVRNGWVISLADEGFNTYQPKSALKKWLDLGEHYQNIAKGFDYSAVDEIWLMSPGLFLEHTHARIVPIDVRAFIDKLRSSEEAAVEFRRFFLVEKEWSYHSFSVALYLRQYFSVLGVLAAPLDAYLDKQFISVLSPFEPCIKDHPAHQNPSYEVPASIIDYKGPLEALIVSRFIADELVPEIFVSPISSALINCAALGVGSKFVFLYKIVEKYCDWRGPDRDILISRLRQLFPDRQFYIPETFEEYIDIFTNGVGCVDLLLETRNWAPHSVDQDLRVMNRMLLEYDKRLKSDHWPVIMTNVKLYIAVLEAGSVTPYGECRVCAAQTPFSNERRILDLTLPSEMSPLVKCRLDIASAPAAITLHNASLHCPDGTEIWRWDGGCSLFVNQVDMVCLPDDEGVLILSLSNDPRCELNLSPDVLSKIQGGSYLRLELTARPLLDALPSVLSRLQAKSEAGLLTTARPQLPATAAGHLAELGELLKTVVERKNATIESQKAEIQALQDRQNALYEQLVRAEAQLDLLKQLVFPEAGSRLERL